MLLRGLFLARKPDFTPTSNEYTSGTQTVSIPAGATYVQIECIAGGSGGAALNPGGGGGAYSKTNAFSVTSLTGIYVSVGAGGGSGSVGGTTFAKENSAGGTTRCLAAVSVIAYNNPGLASGCTGDTKYDGGFGGTYAGGVGASGGGAGGSSGAGSNGSGGTGGAGGGGSAGAGADGVASGAPAAGGNYGGGGASSSDNLSSGGGGWCKLSWT